MTKKVSNRPPRGRKAAIVPPVGVDFDAALGALLKTPTPPKNAGEKVKPVHGKVARQDRKAAKAQFDAAHKRGMDALRSGDYAALGKAINEERATIDAFIGQTAPKRERPARKRAAKKR